ncbi:MAG: PQQ-dependent sugar dehydrogenase [Xanthomonadales bacterium]|nr:PQQ-dependent sugar dehydrogenase [Xanthomonadales bacterium]
MLSLKILLLAAATAPAQIQPELVPVASGFDRPVAVRHAPADASRAFVVEQGGLIHVLNADGSVNPEPFLDLSDRTAAEGERGLLGLAFHPDYATNGRLFVNYTDNPGPTSFSTVIEAFNVDPADESRADRASGAVVLSIPQDFENHNGGDLHFGPDGMLYIGMGDGGGFTGDPNDRAQDPGSLLGKLLRIDVDNPGANPSGACGGAVAYGIPADNPFRADPATCSEIAALGLRNPYRFSFDRSSGDLFIGDVGQGRVEEVDFLPAADLTAGANFGWDCREGDTDYPLSGDPGDDAAACEELELDGSLLDPILVYDSFPSRCSVTGGFRHRGPESRLDGVYFFGDFCTGELFAAAEGGGTWSFQVVGRTGNISGFGEGLEGELYVVSYGGTIERISDPAIFRSGFEANEGVPGR